jgi:hypothetical protein
MVPYVPFVYNAQTQINYPPAIKNKLNTRICLLKKLRITKDITVKSRIKILQGNKIIFLPTKNK